MSEGSDWTLADIPDLQGRRGLVTGVTSGIGEQTALELARHGMEVVLGARDPAELERTVVRIRAAVSGALVIPLDIDLSDLASVRRAASRVEGPLHLLVNNAGVMATPHHRTADGLELQLATHHFGPFALTGLLLDRLVESGDARVVAVSSLAHRIAPCAPLGDPHSARGPYGRWRAHGRSTLADLIFVLELDRRARARGLPVRGVAAHPGLAATALVGTGRDTGSSRVRMRMTATVLQAFFEAAGQPAELGALPTLMAATADLPGSTYVGPGGLLQLKGLPRVVGLPRLARDRDARRRLWEISEEATGVRYLEP